MSNQLSFARGQSYLGTNANQPPNWSFNERDPDQYDTQNVSIGDLWLNTTADRIWCLVSLEGNSTSKGALATWIQLGGGAGNGILTIEGNDGVKVPGDITANINLIGTAPFTFTGNIGSNTVTLSSNGTIATEYTMEDGSIAMPAGGNLNIVGGPNIGTTASAPDTVDIFLTGFTPSAVVVGDGIGGLKSLSAMTNGQLVIGRTGNDPLVGNLTAGANITITNGPGTITIAATGGGGGTLTTIEGDGGFVTGSTVSFLAQPTGGSSLFFQGNGGNTEMALQVTDPSLNTLIGLNAGNLTLSGSENTGFGQNVLNSLTSGDLNTIVGSAAGQSITSGNNNTLIGSDCGSNYVSSESRNTLVGSEISGIAGEIGIVRIGSPSLTGNNNFNTFVGTGSGNNTYTPSSAQANTGIGCASLRSITGGGLGSSGNTALGYNSLGSYTASNTAPFTGGNTAVGSECLAALTTGSTNTAVGWTAMQLATTGNQNTALGDGTLSQLTTGSYNTALGAIAGVDPSGPTGITTGSNNTLIGYNAGVNYTAGESSNIIIMNAGVNGEDHVMRIGTSGSGTGQVNKTFVAGVRGTTTDNNNAIAVLIDSAGQLGTVSSSKRYKENIADMDSYSNNLLNLRPVVFNYKNDESKSRRFGLIAEEVAELFPYLVATDENGHPESVKYHEIAAILLNEVQKLAKRVSELENK